MAVLPLTTAELEAMPRSNGALWPRGVFLRCLCGRTGRPTQIEGHRGRAQRPICQKRPEAFRTMEEAEQRQSDLEADLEDRDDAFLAGAGAETPAATPSRNGKGAARASRSVVSAARSRPQEADEPPRTAMVHVAFDIDADTYARFNQCRLDPLFGFQGKLGEYLRQVEAAYWILVRWLEDGQPIPLSDLAAGLAA